MRLKIAILEGDGVGPEVTREAIRVLHSVASLHGHWFDFVERPIGGAAIKQTGSPLPPTTLDPCLASDAGLLRAVGAPEFHTQPPHQPPETRVLLLRPAHAG